MEPHADEGLDGSANHVRQRGEALTSDVHELEGEEDFCWRELVTFDQRVEHEHGNCRLNTCFSSPHKTHKEGRHVEGHLYKTVEDLGFPQETQLLKTHALDQSLHAWLPGVQLQNSHSRKDLRNLLLSNVLPHS